jgi:hypothetical protein
MKMHGPGNIKYIILIAFPLHQWLNGSASKLRYAFIARMVGIQIDYTTVSLTSS